jgi:SAM-dependent methyltransferase
MNRSRSTPDHPAGISPSFWRLLVEEPLRELAALDVGTGTGRVALGLAPLCRRVVGVDRAVEAIAEAQRRAAELGISNVELVVADAEAIEYDAWRPELVVAHLCVSDAIIARAGRVLAPGRVLAFVAFHTDQWLETGRASRFAYDEARARRVLGDAGFIVEHMEVEREVRTFGSVEEALAAVLGLEERWKMDGRWFHYIKFLEEGGRTLTRSHLIVKARRAP